MKLVIFSSLKSECEMRCDRLQFSCRKAAAPGTWVAAMGCVNMTETY